MKDLKKRFFLLYLFSSLGFLFSFFRMGKFHKILLDRTVSWTAITKYPKNMNKERAIKLLHLWDDNSNKKETLLAKYKRRKLILSENFYSKDDHCIWNIIFLNEKSRKEFFSEYTPIMDNNKRVSLGFSNPKFFYL